MSTIQLPKFLRIEPRDPDELVYIEILPNVLPALRGARSFTLADISEDTRKRLTLEVSGRKFVHQLNALPRSLNLAAVKRSWVLIGGTGTGKTFYYAGLFNELRRLLPEQYPQDQTILFVTDTKVVLQTIQVFKDFGCANVQVTGYDSLRASLGEMYISYRTQIVNGTPRIYPEWCSQSASGICHICCDECQKLKNDDSQTSELIQAAARAGYLITFSSATPFSRAKHVRTIAVALQPIVKIGKVSVRLTDEMFPTWMTNEISDNPLDWHPPDMKRVMDALSEQIIKFENVRFAHLLKIRQITIPFKNADHARIYAEAMQEYDQVCIEAGKDPVGGQARRLVAMQKFAQKAELLRAEYLAESAFKCVNSRTRPINAIIACKHLDTIYVAKRVLMEKFGMLESDIGMLIGGQNKKERQININRFNTERARYCLISVGAGGTGLSLHHTKIKRYPSEMFVPPIWNSEDYVQLIGRGHRINSESTTYLNEVWFAGTIEERIAEKKKRKCLSLKEVVGSGERWVIASDTADTLRVSKQIDISGIKQADEDPLDSSVLDACGENPNASVHQLMI